MKWNKICTIRNKDEQWVKKRSEPYNVSPRKKRLCISWLMQLDNNTMKCDKSMHLTPTCMGTRRTYTAAHRRRIRDEQRIYPVRGVPGATGDDAGVPPPPHGCRQYWNSFWPAQSLPLGHVWWRSHPLQDQPPFALLARLTAMLQWEGTCSSFF